MTPYLEPVITLVQAQILIILYQSKDQHFTSLRQTPFATTPGASIRIVRILIITPLYRYPPAPELSCPVVGLSALVYAWSKDKGGIGIVGCCYPDDVEKFFGAHACQFEPLIRDKCCAAHDDCS